jgi:hypothetical protein
MAQRIWRGGGLLALLLAGAGAWGGTPDAGGGFGLVAESRSAAAYDIGYRDGYDNLPYRYSDRSSGDYAQGYRTGQARRQALDAGSPASRDYKRGYGDGLNGKGTRERDGDYRAGYRAGWAKHQANEARPDGRDYSRGYRDGFKRYRERLAVASRNRAYASGFRAGQADHVALVAGSPVLPMPPIETPPPTHADNLLGRPAATLDRDMKSLGFVLLGQYRKGAESFTTWQSQGLNRCLRIVTRDGKVQQVTDVDNTNCT